MNTETEANNTSFNTATLFDEMKHSDFKTLHDTSAQRENEAEVYEKASSGNNYKIDKFQFAKEIL